MSDKEIKRSLHPIFLRMVIFSTLLNNQIAIGGSLGDLDSHFKQAHAIGNVAVSMRHPRSYEDVKKLPQATCTFSSSSPQKIKGILKLFNEFDVRKMPENQVFLPFVEIEMHFSFKSGKKAVLYLGKRYLGEKTIDGELTIEGQSTPLYFWVNRNLSERLQMWSQFADNFFISPEVYMESDEAQCWDSINGKIESSLVSCGRTGAILSHPELCANK